jgi:hypothetical protein
VQKSTNSLDNNSISTFSNPIVLRGIMHSALSLRTTRIEVQDKLLSLVFSTAVRMEDLDFGPQLGVAPSLVVLVGFEGVGLLGEEI